MTIIKRKKVFIARNLVLILLTLVISSCKLQLKKKTFNNKKEDSVISKVSIIKQSPMFPQIHSNLNGMVSEFVRTMHQDKKGNYWFGTNGNGIIRYDGQTLEAMSIEGVSPYMRVLEIVEDKAGVMWFGTSDGLIKFDGTKFTRFSKKEGLPGQDEEIWGLLVDRNGLIWVGATGGVCHFDGEKFIPFSLPDAIVENRKSSLSKKLVFKIIEEKSGTIWFANDGNGIFKYYKGEFTHLTNKNGLTDNHAGNILEDSQGNVWIGTFSGGTSKFDGTTFHNFTKDGIITGEETGGFYEDSKGNIWFTAENVGVYKYDGANFTIYTTKNGLTADLVLSIFEDKKGQYWFGTWQGLCIFDGEKFVNASELEPWTK